MRFETVSEYDFNHHTESKKINQIDKNTLKIT